MSKGIRVEEAASVYGEDTLESRAREWIRGFIEGLLEEELTLALGVKRSGRVGDARRGYRHGVRPRTVTTSLGPTSFSMPRARVFEGEAAKEWSSEVLPRYQRRTRRVVEAILGLYLRSEFRADQFFDAAGAGLRGGSSKGVEQRGFAAISETDATCGRGDFGVVSVGGQHAADQGSVVAAASGSSSVEGCGVAAGGEVVGGLRGVAVSGSVGGEGGLPFSGRLVSAGAAGQEAGESSSAGHDGCSPGRHSRVVLDFRLAGQESVAGWREAIVDLSERGIGVPKLAVIDGSAGLEKALGEVWPKIAIQRCTAHKLRNLEGKAPVRMREELREDYRRMIYAETAAAVEQARARFIKKWRLACPPVAASLEEAGEELFTLLKFPKSQWKALRTTTALERINEEFRRRTKTQASLPSESAVLLLLFGLLRSGQIRLRAIDGCHEIKAAA